VRCQMALFPVTLNDPQLPQTTTFSTFGIAFQIFEMGGDRDFTFDSWVDRSKS